MVGRGGGGREEGDRRGWQSMVVGGRSWWQGGGRGGSGSECSASGRHTFQPDDSLAISLHLAGRPHAAAVGADARVPPTGGIHEWPGCVSLPSWLTHGTS